MTIDKQLARIIGFMAVIGILAHVFGEALPRRWFLWDRGWYRIRPWEQAGRFYERLGIRRWKDHLPDKSRFTKRTFTKELWGHGSQEDLTRLLQETCVAELVHWVLLLIAPLMYWFVPTPLGLCAAVLYGLSNLPFIMIQRYNRPRLVRLLSRRRPSQPKEAAI